MINFFMRLIGLITWDKPRKWITGKSYNLTIDDWYEIKEKLSTGYYIILTYRKSHLSTYATVLAHFFLTGRWSFWSHALVNVESDRASYGFPDFQFMEAIGKGVVRTNWYNVFNVDKVCVLKPKYYTIEEFNGAVSSVYDDEGKKYDLKQNVNESERLSCVELARERMIELPDYFEKMRVFEFMIKNEKRLTPQMFRECPDFEVVLEISK